jgi:predicted RNA-binding protein (virulence factor B family)
MAEIGKYNQLKVAKEVEFGVYLNDEEHGEILLPRRYVPEQCSVGDELEVFIYLDSEQRIIATTEKPFAQAGEFAYLEVVSVSAAGAFLNWGLMKDLLLPYREQRSEVKEGEKVFVYIYLDMESKRLVASSKIDKHIDNLPAYYQPGDDADAIVWAKTDLGYKVIMENLYSGILYKNEVFEDLQVGQSVQVFVKKIRDDEKIDLALYKPGYEKVDDSAHQVLKYLKAHDGFMPFHDKSPAEGIQSVFGMSKKTFKKALGALYKSKLVELVDGGVKLNG